MAKRKAQSDKGANPDSAIGVGGGEAPADSVYLGQSDKPEFIYLRLANRHGLIAGATGPARPSPCRGWPRASPCRSAGLRRRREGRSFRPCRTGEAKHGSWPAPKRSATTNESTGSRSSSGTCSASRAIRSAPPSPRWGRCCSRACSISTTPRRACSTSPSSSPTRRPAAPRPQGLAGAALGICERAPRALRELRQCRNGVRRADPAQRCSCSSSKAARISSASPRSRSPT